MWRTAWASADARDAQDALSAKSGTVRVADDWGERVGVSVKK